MEPVKEIGVAPKRRKARQIWLSPFSYPIEEKENIAAGNWYALHGKRLFDITVSLGLLIALSWLFPVLYLLVKLTSKGPFLFEQLRVGRYGQIFRCYKVRSMYPNLAADTLQAAGDDKRITPAGKLLRRSHLDELPQLFNVLRGDMSLIGPRPHMISDDLYFLDAIPEYASRRNVLPGLTGLAQVKGYRGPTPNYRSIAGRTKLDAFYADNVSFGLDLKIALATLFIHFSDK